MGDAANAAHLLAAARTAEEVLWAEKNREDRLRALGWVVVRIVWAELTDPDQLRQRITSAARTARSGPAASLARKLCAVLAVLTFYISLSAVWTFIGGIAAGAGLSPAHSGQVLAVATLLGIVGAGAAALIGARFGGGRLIVLGYALLLASVALLTGQPLLLRFALAALLFKFTWTFVLPFILARVAGLDNDGKLMNGINLVIGGGMAIGPTLAGSLIESSGGFNALLFGALGCALLSLLLISLASPRAPRRITGGER